jgi:hypothetical protein
MGGLSETHLHQTCNSRRSPLLKLWMSVAYRFIWKFNLIVSIEILVYKTAVGAVKF